MANYKEIKGKSILHIASDLTNAEGEGQIWFNTDSSDFKTIVKVAGTWSSGTSINTARFGAGMAGAAPSSDALIFGGSSNVCEKYDGSSWTELADLSTARAWAGGFGASSTAALCASGEPVSVNAETWNGTGWTEGVDMNTARVETKGAGTTTAAVVFGGSTPSIVNNSEEFTLPVETTVEFDAS